MIVEVPNTEIVVEDTLDVSVGSCEVEVVDLADLDVTVSKKEYVITGDEIYIPMLYDDAPQWMKELVQVVVDVTVESNNQGLVNDLNAIVAGFATSYVPLNQYTQSIVDLSNEDGRLNTLIETLNSNFSDGLSDANAQIVSLQLTKASKDEVVAQVIQTIAAQLADNSSNIGATIGRIDQAIADETSARASSFQVLTSSLDDTNLDVTANATATSLLNTYVGLELGAPNGTGLLADVEILQKQNDGVIETTTGTYDVIVSPENPDLAQLVVTAEPYATWKAADVSGIDTRLAHIGDVYVKYADTPNGAKEYIASYKFIRTAVDTTSPYATDSDGFTWALIVDQVAQDAYEQALNAYDLADNKRRVFTVTPSGPYDVGDLWTKTVTGGSMLYKSIVKRSVGYSSSDWIVADDAGLNQFVDITYTPTITSLQNQIDGKIESWYTASTNDPKTAWVDAPTRTNHDGDMWYQTDTKLSYYYSSSTNAWNLVDDAKAIQALADAATAQATADGKISSYYLSTLAEAQSMSSGWTPTEKTNNVGDLVVVWNDSTLDNNGTWRWNGTSWVTARDKKLVALASDVTVLSTELDNGTNTWASADSNLENSLMTEISDEGARVESKFAYNSLLNINGIYKKSGFGLTTNYVSGSGTQVDPYVSEFWIDASRFKFTNSNVTGSVAPFTIDASGATPQIEFNGRVSFGNIYDQTIIQNGYINTGLIQANTINANQINTVGLIAENISANEIVGKTMTGSIINGAVINGAVIKASYLDLDGQLQVLTNYHLCTSSTQLNAILASGGYGELYSNSSIMPDAVYMSGSNEWRIPSISNISENMGLVGIGSGSVVNGSMRSFNTYNAGHNRKAVYIRPTFYTNNGTNILNGSLYSYIDGDGFSKPTNGLTINDGVQVYLRLGGIVLAHFSLSLVSYGFGCNSVLNVSGGYASASVGVYSGSVNSQGSSYVINSASAVVSGIPIIGDITISVTASATGGWVYGGDQSNFIRTRNDVNFSISLNGSVSTLPFNWSSSGDVINLYSNYVIPTYGSCNGRISGININNMIAP